MMAAAAAAMLVGSNFKGKHRKPLSDRPARIFQGEVTKASNRPLDLDTKYTRFGFSVRQCQFNSLLVDERLCMPASIEKPQPCHLCPDMADKANTKTLMIPVISRKSSLKTSFSSSSLSSLALGRRDSKRTSFSFDRSLKRKSLPGRGKLGSLFMSGCKDDDTTSRPPSLITDISSLASSRSPSPEPLGPQSKIGTAFQLFIPSQSGKILSCILMPLLSAASADDISKEDQMLLFKWWNHLLLISASTQTTHAAIYAIASHICMRSSIDWASHYELTLSTTLSAVPSAYSHSLLASSPTLDTKLTNRTRGFIPTLVPPSRLGVASGHSQSQSHSLPLPPTAFFAKILALGYVNHPATRQVLTNLFADPTRTNDSEPWVRRAKNVEVFIEITKAVYLLDPSYNDNGVIQRRLTEMIFKVVQTTYSPNHRLVHLCKLLSTSHLLPAVAWGIHELIERAAVEVTKRIRAFDQVATFYLLDFLSCVRFTKTTDFTFWKEVYTRILSTESHVLQIHVFSLLYEKWHHFPSYFGDWILSLWSEFFAHWSSIVRDHYMRLIAYWLSISHAEGVQNALQRSFQTAVLEGCQLQDCLPGNPIPNKRFVIKSVHNSSRASVDQVIGNGSGRSGTISSAFSVDKGRDALSDALCAEQGKAAELSISKDRTYDALNEVETMDGLQRGPEIIGTVGFMRRKLGFLRKTIWTDEDQAQRVVLKTSGHVILDSGVDLDAKEGKYRDASGNSLSNTSDNGMTWKFNTEVVGKRWMPMCNFDAVSYLDNMMNRSRLGRLPVFSPLSPALSTSPDTLSVPTAALPFDCPSGRKRLWTRSLGEWATLLDETDRFYRNQKCGKVIAPKLEVEFPRWFTNSVLKERDMEV